MARVQELELCVGHAAIFRINIRRFGTVPLAHRLDKALARIELLTQPLAQFAVAGGKVILGDWIESECANRGGNRLTGGAQLLTDGGEKETLSVHTMSAFKVFGFTSDIL